MSDWSHFLQCFLSRGGPVRLVNLKKAFKLLSPVLIPLAITTGAEAYTPNPMMGVSPVVPGHHHEHEKSSSTGSSKSVARSAKRNTSPRLLSAQPYEISVLYLYTDDTYRLNPQQSAEISNNQVIQKIHQLNNLAQDVFQNSAIPYRVVPIAIEKLPGNFNSVDNQLLLVELNKVLVNEGGNTVLNANQIATFNRLKAKYRPDMIILMRGEAIRNQNSCGVSNLLSYYNSLTLMDRPNEYTRVLINTMGWSTLYNSPELSQLGSRAHYCDDITLAHEIGHNLGGLQSQEMQWNDPATGERTESVMSGYWKDSSTNKKDYKGDEVWELIKRAPWFSNIDFNNPAQMCVRLGVPCGDRYHNNRGDVMRNIPDVLDFFASVQCRNTGSLQTLEVVLDNVQFNGSYWKIILRWNEDQFIITHASSKPEPGCRGTPEVFNEADGRITLHNVEFAEVPYSQVTLKLNSRGGFELESVR